MNMKAKMECKIARNIGEYIYTTGVHISFLITLENTYYACIFTVMLMLSVHKPMPICDMLYFLIRVNGFSLFMNSLY